MKEGNERINEELMTGARGGSDKMTRGNEKKAKEKNLLR